MNLNDILATYKSLFQNEERYNLASQGDNIEVCNVGTDFASVGMFKEAIGCWEYIVAQGTANADAYCNLGVCYYYGNGVEMDKRKAVRYYQRAAALGHPFGQYNLAVACEYGQGTPKDMKKAIEFYRKAAEQHVNQAIEALIRLGIYNETYLQFYQRNLEDDSFAGNI